MTTLNSYDAGQSVHLTVAFTDNGTPADPSAVTLTVYKPDDTSAQYTYALAQVQKATTGNYFYDLDTTGGRQGLWRYVFAGSGAVKAVSHADFWLDDPSTRTE